MSMEHAYPRNKIGLITQLLSEGMRKKIIFSFMEVRDLKMTNANRTSLLMMEGLLSSG